eukprot:m.181684 g.181684  ORF g.181684 m.181684 type:complete len:5518 (-) comp14663_c1_seq3:1709-18262(-)
MNYDQVTARMDSRHWWLVSKLQESFGKTLRSAQLERFLCQVETLPALLSFTAKAELYPPHTLFVWQLNESPAGAMATSVSSVPSMAANLGMPQDFAISHDPPSAFVGKCVYFVKATRKDPPVDATATTSPSPVPTAPCSPRGSPRGSPRRMSRTSRSQINIPEMQPITEAGDSSHDPEEDSSGDVYASLESFRQNVMWGEVDAHVDRDMLGIYQGVLVPFLSQNAWGDCTAEQQSQLKQSLDKLVNTLPSATSGLHARLITLSVPDAAIVGAFKPGVRSADADVLASAESILEDWMEVIDEVLQEATFDHPLHYVGVDGERMFWKDRQTVLFSITDQLKTKPAQSLIGLLISCQSKAVRRWRTVDSAITEAANECKDFIKYLDSIMPSVQGITNSDPDAIYSSLQALNSVVKPSSTLVKHSNAMFFFQSLFHRLTQQVVASCKSVLKRPIDAEETEEDVGEDPFQPPKTVSLVPKWLVGNDQDGYSVAVKSTMLDTFSKCSQICEYYLDVFQNLLAKRFQSWKTGTRRSRGSDLSTVSGVARESFNVRPGSQHVGSSHLAPGSKPSSPSSARRSARGDVSMIPPSIFQAVKAFSARIQSLKSVLTSYRNLELMSKSISGWFLFPYTQELVADIEQMDALLVQNLTCLDIIEPLDSYQKAAVTLNEVVDKAEKYIQDGLALGIERASTTALAIEYIKRFMVMDDVVGVKGAINDAIVQLFLRYEVELEQVHKLYESNKESPPIPRCSPPTVGHIMWARQLLSRLELPMLFFKQYSDLIQNAGPVSRTFTLYNNLSKALLKYETLWLSKWRSRISDMLVGLKATLIVEHPTSGKLLLNADPSVLCVVDEAKQMKAKGLPVPAQVRGLVDQAEKFKTFSSALSAVLARNERVQANVKDLVRPLLNATLRNVAKAFRPGLISLTWTASNIDAYIARVQTALDLLENTTSSINAIIDDGISKQVNEATECQFLTCAWWGPFSTNAFELAQVKGWEEISERCGTLIEETMANAERVIDLAKQSEEQARKRLHSELTQEEDTIASLNAFNASSSELLNILSLQLQQGFGRALISSLDNFKAMLESTLEVQSDGTSSSQIQWYHQPSLQTVVVAETSREQQGYIEVDVEVSSPTIVQDPDADSIAAVLHRVILSAQDSAQRLCKGTGSSANDVLRRALVRIPTHKPSPPKDDPSQGRQRTRSPRFASRDTQRQHHRDQQQLVDMHVIHLASNPNIRSLTQTLNEVVDGLVEGMHKGLARLSAISRAWEQESSTNALSLYSRATSTVLKTDASLSVDIQGLSRMQSAIETIPPLVSVGGPFFLKTRHMCLALHAEANAWKAENASGLYTQAADELQRISSVVDGLKQQLNQEINTLEDLQRMIQVLQDIDSHSEAFDIPSLEHMFEVLQEIGLTLPRQELAALSALKEECEQVALQARQLRTQLTTTRRPEFERLLDSQTKSLLVATIHLRNSFDHSGPMIEGISPSEALLRLRRLTELFKDLAVERDTLMAAESLLGIKLSSYPELDRTHQDLSRLERLYGLYESFLQQQQRFLECLWVSAQLQVVEDELLSMQTSLNTLPDDLKVWAAFKEMTTAVKNQLEVLPLLKRLAAPCIRDRHWREIMHMTGVTFPLEGLTVQKLMSLELPKYAPKIEELTRSALGEAELESSLLAIQSSWSENVFVFAATSSVPQVFLDEDVTQNLMASAQQSHMRLQTMLGSPSLGPHRADIISWLAKLKEIGAFLSKWVQVQQLWQSLDAVTKLPRTDSAKKVLQSVLRDMSKFASLAQETGNIMQFCFGGDGGGAKMVVLQAFMEQLEGAKKTLASFVSSKRQSYSRYHFLSDAVLLGALGLEMVEGEYVRAPRALRQLLPAVHFFHVVSGRAIETSATIMEVGEEHDEEDGAEDRASDGTRDDSEHQDMIDPEEATTPQGGSPLGSRSGNGSLQALNSSFNSPHGATQSDVDTSMDNDGDGLYIKAVASEDGERLQLQRFVRVNADLTTWLPALEEAIDEAIQAQIMSACSNLPDTSAILDADASLAGTTSAHNLVEGLRGESSHERSQRRPKSAAMLFSPMVSIESDITQVAHVATRMFWTAAMLMGIDQVRVNRFALRSAQQDIHTWCSKVVSACTGARRKTRRKALSRKKLQTLFTLLLHLRDVTDEIVALRCRDTNDFSWLKQLRWLMNGVTQRPELVSLYCSVEYGPEFVGVPPPVAVGPSFDKNHTLLLQGTALGGGPHSTAIPAVLGSSKTGKYTMAASLATMLGRNLVDVQCTAVSSPTALTRLVDGICYSKAWGLLSECWNLPLETLSAVVQHIRLLHLNMDGQRSKYQRRNSSIQAMLAAAASPMVIANRFVIFASCTASSTSSLPESVRSCFRIIELSKPAPAVIVYSQCLASGAFTAPKESSERIVRLYQLASEMFDATPWVDFGISAMLVLVNMCRQLHNTPKIQNSIKESLRAGQRVSGRMSSRTSSPLKMATSQPVVADPDMVLVAHAFHTLYSSALPTSDQSTLLDLIHTIAPSFHETTMFDTDGEQMLRDALHHCAEKAGYVPEERWLDVAMSIHKEVQQHRTVLVLGPPGTGKTSAITTLVDALNVLGKKEKRENIASNVAKARKGSISAFAKSSETAQAKPHSQHRIHRVFPGALTSEQLLGYSHNDTWHDGVIASVVREANMSSSTTTHWLVLDGPCTHSWAHYFYSALLPNSQGYITLGNGDQMFLGNNIKVVFEMIPEESDSTPLFAGNVGSVYVESQTLSWRAIVSPWLGTRRVPEAQLLRPIFDRYMDLMLQACEEIGNESVETAMPCKINTLLKIMTSLLADSVTSAIILPPVHIECIFLFAMTWGLGGSLVLDGRAAFHQHLAAICSLLPDDAENTTIFDYCLSPAADWELWSEYAEDMNKEQSTLAGPSGGFRFVYTKEAACTLFLLNALQSQGIVNALIVGHVAVGKRRVTRQLAYEQRHADMIRNLPLCGSTTASLLQDFMSRNTQKRTGHVYGADGGKPLLVLADSVDVCRTPHSSASKLATGTTSTRPERHAGVPHEMLRLLLEEGLWFENPEHSLNHRRDASQNDSVEPRWITDVGVVATALPQYDQSSSLKRLARHLSVLYLPEPCPASALQIMSSNASLSLEAQLQRMRATQVAITATDEMHQSVMIGGGGGGGDTKDRGGEPSDLQFFGQIMLMETICDMLQELLELVRHYFHPDTKSKAHYVFNLNDAMLVIKALQRLQVHAYSPSVLAAFWAHECMRVFADRCISAKERKYFAWVLSSILSKRTDSFGRIPSHHWLVTCAEEPPKPRPTTAATRLRSAVSTRQLREQPSQSKLTELEPVPADSVLASEKACTTAHIVSVDEPPLVRIARSLASSCLSLYDVFVRRFGGTTHLAISAVPVDEFVEELMSLCAGCVSRQELSSELSQVATDGKVTLAAVIRLAEMISPDLEPYPELPAYTRSTPHPRSTSGTQEPEAGVWPELFADGVHVTFTQSGATPSTHATSEIVPCRPISLPTLRFATRGLRAQSTVLVKSQTNYELELMLSVTRTLTMSNSHAIYVASMGSGARNAIENACAITGCSLTRLSVSSLATFNRDMRGIYRSGGSKNEKVCAVVYGEDLVSDVLQALNSFVTTGSIFNLFASEEERALYDGVEEDLADSTVPGQTAQDLFEYRLAANVHVVIIFDDLNAAFHRVCSNYPDLIRLSYMHVVNRLTAEEARARAVTTLAFDRSFVDLPLKDMLRLADAIAVVHSSVRSLNLLNNSGLRRVVRKVAAATQPESTSVVTFDESGAYAKLNIALKMFTVVYSEKKQQMVAKRGQLETVLQNCDKTDSFIAGLQEAAHANAQRIVELKESVQEALVALSACAADAISVMADEGLDSDDDEEMLAAFVHYKRSTARTQGRSHLTDQHLASQRLQQALEDVHLWQSKLTLKRIDALRVLSNPPNLVRLVADMMMIVLRCRLPNDVNTRRGYLSLPDNWATTIVLLQNPNVVDRLQNFDPMSIDDETVELLEVYFNLPSLSRDSVHRASKDTVIFLEWIMKLMELRRVLNKRNAPPQLLESHHLSAIPEDQQSATASRAPSAKQRKAAMPDHSTTGLSIISQSEQVNELQQEYDRLVSLQQQCELNAERLATQLTSANKQRQSFTDHLPQWQQELKTLREGQWALFARSLHAASMTAYAGDVGCAQQHACALLLAEKLGQSLTISEKEHAVTRTTPQHEVLGSRELEVLAEEGGKSVKKHGSRPASAYHAKQDDGSTEEPSGADSTSTSGSAANADAFELASLNMEQFLARDQHLELTMTDAIFSPTLDLPPTSKAMARMALACKGTMWPVFYDPSRKLVDWLKKKQSERAVSVNPKLQSFHAPQGNSTTTAPASGVTSPEELGSTRATSVYQATQPSIQLMQSTVPDVLSHVPIKELVVTSYGSATFAQDLKQALARDVLFVVQHADESTWRDPLLYHLLHRIKGRTSQGYEAVVLGSSMIELHPGFSIVFVSLTQPEIPHSLVMKLLPISLLPSAAEYKHMVYAQSVKRRQPKLFQSAQQTYDLMLREKRDVRILEMQLLQLLEQSHIDKEAGTSVADQVTSLHSVYVNALQRWKQTKTEVMSQHSGLSVLRSVANALSTIIEGVQSLSALDARYMLGDICERAFNDTLDAVAEAPSLTAKGVAAKFCAVILETFSVEMPQAHRSIARLVLAVKAAPFVSTTADHPVDTTAFYAWLHRPHCVTFDDWNAIDTGLSVDSKTTAVPLADLKLKTAQFDARIASLVQSVVSVPWIAPLSSFVERLARHRGDWCAWRESPQPVASTLPSLGDQPSPEGLLMLSTALRPDRFYDWAEAYVSTVLGNTPDELQGHQTATAIHGSDCSSVSLLVCSNSSSQLAVASDLQRFCDRINIDCIISTFTKSMTPAEASRYCEYAMSEGKWLICTHVHNNPEVALALFSKFNTFQPGSEIAKSSRLVLIHDSEQFIPATITSNSALVSVGGMLPFRQRVAYLLQEIHGDVLNCSSRAEWLSLLHNMVYLHCVLNARSDFGLLGWTKSYSWSDDTLGDIIEFASRQYVDSDSSHRITSIRNYMEMLYSAVMTSSRDKKVLSLLLSQWITVSATKPGFEFFKASDGSHGYKQMAVPQKRNKQSALREMGRIIATTKELDDMNLDSICLLPGVARSTDWVSSSSQLLSSLRHLTPTLDASGRSATVLETWRKPPKLLKRAATKIDTTSGRRGHTRRTSGKPPSTTQTAKATHSTPPCPAYRPQALHVCLHNAPMLSHPFKVRRKLQANATPPILIRYFVAQAQALYDQHKALRSALKQLDDFCLGLLPPQPAFAAQLKLLAKGLVPEAWRRMMPTMVSASSAMYLDRWMESAIAQYKDMEKTLSAGARALSLNLGAFPNPKGLLAALKAKAALDLRDDNPTFHADITAREREHLRETPNDGFFLHGMQLHGALWETPPGEAKETSSYVRAALPVVHIHFSATKTESEEKKGRVGRGDDIVKKRGPVKCNVYHSVTQHGEGEVLFPMLITCEDADLSSAWNLRGVCVSLL